MKWKNSIASLALAGCLLASTVPAVAFADYQETVVQQQVNAETDLMILNDKTDGKYYTYLSNTSEKGNANGTEVTIELEATGDLASVNKLDVNISNEDVLDLTDAASNGLTQKGTDKSNYTANITNGKASIKFKAKVGATGTCTITFTANTDNGVPYKASYEIKVGSPKYMTAKIDADDQSIEYIEPDQTVDMMKRLKYTPSDTTQKLSGSDIKFSSSDPKVVMGTDNGKLQIKGRGTATVTAKYTWIKSSGQEEAVFQFKVTVTDKDGKFRAVLSDDSGKGSTNASKSESLVQGQSLKLIAQYREKSTSDTSWSLLNDDEVEWKSSNPSAVTVDNTGRVVAVGKGTASITYTTKAEGVVSDPFTVQVKTEGQLASGVAFDQPTLSIVQGTRSTEVRIVTTPADADVSKLNIVVNGDTGSTDNRIFVNNIQQKKWENYDKTLLAVTSDSSNAKETGITLEAIMSGGNMVGLDIGVGDEVEVGDYAIKVPVSFTNGKQEGVIKYATCVITVTKPGEEAVQSFELKQYDCDSDGYKEAKDKSLYTNTIIPVVNPDGEGLKGDNEEKANLGVVDQIAIEPASLKDDVSYDIDDKSVADLVEVDGVWNVIALKAGSAQLTAKVGDKTDTVTLKVQDPEAEKKLTAAKINDDMVALNVDDFQDLGIQIQLNNGTWEKLAAPEKGNRLPATNATGGTYSPVWSSGDESIATIDKNGRVTGVKSGTTKITAQIGSFVATTTVVVVGENQEPVPDNPTKPDVKPEAPKFTDVEAGTWYADAVSAVVAEGWMDGTSATTFNPTQNLSRAMAAEILWAKNGKEYVAYNGKFTDVETNDWYAQAVAWAANKGIVAGKSTTIFDPKGDISRQDFALMLAKEEGAALPTDTKALDKYQDKADIADYADEAIAWAVENKLISGVGENAENVRPTWTMTRAQAAQMFSHLIKEDAPEKTPDEGSTETDA